MATIAIQVLEVAAIEYLSQQLAPVQGTLADKHVTGSQYGTPIPLVWGSFRVDALIQYALYPPFSFVSSKIRKYRYTYLSGFCYCPEIQVGGIFGADISKIWINGVLHYDEGRLINTEPPAAFLDGTQTSVTPIIAADSTATQMAYQGLVGVTWNRLNVFWFGSNSMPAQQSALVNAGSPALATVLARCMLLQGYTSADYDFSDVAGISIHGCAFLNAQNFGDFMKTLCEFCGVDMFESEGVVKARRRDASLGIDRTIAWDDIGEIDDPDLTANPTQKIKETIAYAQDLPSQVRVLFANLNANYQVGSVTATRDPSTSTEPVQVDYSMISMTADDALLAAQRTLDEMYLKQRTFEFSLGPTYWDMVPGDTLSLPLDAAGTRVEQVRVSRISNRNEAGCFTVTCYRIGTTFSQTSTGSHGTGGGGDGGSGNLVTPTGIAVSGIEPYPNDPLASRPNVLTAATWPSNCNRAGVDVFYSLASDPSTKIAAGTIVTRSPLGTATSLMPAASQALDFETRLTGVLLDQAPTFAGDIPGLASTSHTQAIAGTNLTIFGKEVQAFSVAALTGAGAYNISDIYGGEYSSAFTGHLITDRFAVIDQSGMLRINFDPSIEQSLIGTVVTVYLVASGDDIAHAAVYTVVIGAPAANAIDPDSVQVLAPTWWHNAVYRKFQPVFNAANPVQTGYVFEFQYSTDNGVTWKGPDTTANTVYRNKAFFEAAWIPGQTMRVRARTITPNGSVGNWVLSANIDYLPPHLMQEKFPADVAALVAMPAYTYSGGFLTANANGALPTLDGFSTYVVAVSGTLPTRILLTQEGQYNGIWDVAQVGDVSHPWKLTRSPDIQQSTDLVIGLEVYVQNGTSGSGDWKLTGPLLTALVINTTALVFKRQTPGATGILTPWREKITSTGAATTTLSHTPASDDDLTIIIDGLEKWPGDDYTFSGNVVTWVSLITVGKDIKVKGRYA